MATKTCDHHLDHTENSSFGGGLTINCAKNNCHVTVSSFLSSDNHPPPQNPTPKGYLSVETVARTSFAGAAV